MTAFSISVFTSMGGVSGAILILPFQVSFLGFTGPAVSPTNLIYNIIAIPSGVLRYIREQRMVWPLAWIIIVGTTPGIFLGALARIYFLPDPRLFKLFAGAVLAYIGYRLIIDLVISKTALPTNFQKFEVSALHFSLREMTYNFNDVTYRIVVWKIFLLSSIVGLVGGVYGIGGGAIIAPFLVAMFSLPVHSIAGVTLFGTFISSIAGVLFYSIFSWSGLAYDVSIAPDWALGGLFGVGGAAGMYVGARIQKFIPARVIKGILAALVSFVALKYIFDFFQS